MKDEYESGLTEVWDDTIIDYFGTAELDKMMQKMTKAEKEVYNKLQEENKRLRNRVNDTLEELAFVETVLHFVREDKKKLKEK